MDIGVGCFLRNGPHRAWRLQRVRVATTIAAAIEAPWEPPVRGRVRRIGFRGSVLRQDAVGFDLALTGRLASGKAKSAIRALAGNHGLYDRFGGRCQTLCCGAGRIARASCHSASPKSIVMAAPAATQASLSMFALLQTAESRRQHFDFRHQGKLMFAWMAACAAMTGLGRLVQIALTVASEKSLLVQKQTHKRPDQTMIFQRLKARTSAGESLNAPPLAAIGNCALI